MPKCPNCGKEVYFGEISAFFCLPRALKPQFLVFCVAGEMRVRAFHAEISFFLKKVLRLTM